MRGEPLPDLMPSGWWTTRRIAIGFVLLSLVPLLWPSMPPLIDLPGHIGRYRVQLGLSDSAALQSYFDFHWALLGNLGVDLLVEPLAPLLGLEPAVKLIILSIPATTVMGLLLIAREAHGRLPPTAFFALPLAYGAPFQFGFVNFALSMGWALLAFGLWLRLARLGRFRLRAALFVPIAMLIWLAHGFGWAVLGLLAFAAEIARARSAGRPIGGTILQAGIACLPLVPPVLLMLAWRSGDVAGQTVGWFNAAGKLLWFGAMLREHWLIYDLGCVLFLCGVVLAGLLGIRIDRDPMLALAAAMLLLAFLLLPSFVMGSGYADMRLAPYVVAIALTALAPGRLSARGASLVAMGALAFFVMRTATTSIVFATHDRAWRQQLDALDHVARGSRVFALVKLPCQGTWDASRMDNIASYALVRRDAFVNAQWQMPGAQLLRIRYAAAPGFDTNPSQVARPGACLPPGIRPYADSVRDFPRHAFDYLWLIDVPPGDWPHDPGLILLWHGPTGALYRIAHPLPRTGVAE